MIRLLHLCAAVTLAHASVTQDNSSQWTPGPPGRPLVMSFSSRMVNLSWTPPPPDMSARPANTWVTGYRVRVRRGENTSWEDSVSWDTGDTETRATVTKLRPFTVYSFRVAAIYSGGEESESEESFYMITLREAPSGSPTITVAHNISSNALYMAWEPPHPLTINGEFLGYKLSYESRSLPGGSRSRLGRGRGARQSVVIKNPGLREYILRDLATYTEYTLALQVLNPEGEGPATKVMVMTDEGVPSPPMYTTVHTITNTSAVIDWSRPSDPNGVIEGYHLYFLSGNLTDVRTIRSKDPRIEYTLTRLSPFSTYYVWIRAFTWKHEGESSTKLSVRTDVSAPIGTSITNISCSEDNRVRVQWSECEWFRENMEGRAQCVYTVRVTEAHTGDIVEEIRVNNTGIPMDNDTDLMEVDTGPLAPDTTYKLSVQAASVSVYRSEEVYPGPWSEGVHLHLQNGCQLTYTEDSGDKASNMVTSLYRNTNNGSGPGVIAGVVVTTIILVIILIGIIVWNKFCKESYYYLEESGGGQSSNIATQWETEVQHRVTAEQFLAQVKNLHLEGDREFVVHFKNLTAPGETHNNHNNNGTSGGGPGRVVRSSHTDTCSYEAPFYVDGYNQPRAFLATPLPLPYKFNFFWKQIWEQKVSVIVMLENIAENGKVICDQYWPEHKAQYGHVDVSLHNTERLANFTIRTFHLSSQSLGKKGDVRQVTQLQFTSWPAAGNPPNPLPLLSFIRVALKQNELRSTAMVVHTNSRNSRAGVFITIASTLKQLKTSGEVNIPSFLKQAPTKGQNLLRSAKDFIYIHDVLVEAIVAGETNIKSSYLSRYINSLQSCQYSPSGNKYHIERQFELLNIDFIKKDKAPEPATDLTWLPGYFSQRSFVLAAYPSPEGLQQFWRLVLEQSVHTIVVVKSDPCQNFPDLSSAGQGPVIVTHRDDEISYDFKSKNFILEFGTCVRKFVKVIFSETFLSEGESPGESLSLVESVGARNKAISRSSPVIVLDSDMGGAAGAGLCALLSLADQCEQEEHCDVYQAVKTVNMARRGEWSSPESLLHIYRVAEMMVTRGDTSKPTSGRNIANNINIALNRKSPFKISINNWKNKTDPTPPIKVDIPVISDGWF